MAMQTVVYSLPPRQKQFMDREAERLGISTAELVRRIIDREEERTRPPQREPTDGRG